MTRSPVWLVFLIGGIQCSASHANEFPPLVRTLIPHAGVGIGALAFSPDGTLLATGGDDGRIFLWEIPSGKQVRSLDGHKGRICALVFSPDGRRLASASGDETVALWNPIEGQRLLSGEGHEGCVLSLAFSPDGKTLASGSFDNTIRLWDVPTNKLRGTLAAHDGAVSALAFTPDKQLLLSAGYDRRVVFWDAQKGSERQRLQSPRRAGEITGLVVGADNRFVVAGTSSFILDTEINVGPNWNHELNFGGGILCSANSGDRRILAFGTNSGDVVLAEVASRRVVGTYAPNDKGTSLIRCVALSSDSLMLAAGLKSGRVYVQSVPRVLYEDQPQPPQRSVEDLWNDLLSKEGERGLRAVFQLQANPETALAMLKKNLLPLARLDEKEFEALVRDLDSDEFQVRDRAFQTLAKRMRAVEPLVRAALRKTESVEVRSSLRRLLDLLDVNGIDPEQLRQLRALQILELINTAEARAHLGHLAQGRSGASFTEEAKSALDRLALRPLRSSSRRP